MPLKGVRFPTPATRWKVAAIGLGTPQAWTALSQWIVNGVAISAAADPDPALLSRARAELGVPSLYHSWEELLHREPLNAISLFLPPGRRAEVVEEASARGLHCLTSGPMTGSLDQAERIVTACRRNRTRLVVSWPHLDAATLYQIALCAEGELGESVLWTHTACWAPRLAALHPPSAVAEFSIPEELDNGDSSLEELAHLLLPELLSPAMNVAQNLIGMPAHCSAVFARTHPGRSGGMIRSQATLSYQCALASGEGTILAFPGDDELRYGDARGFRGRGFQNRCGEDLGDSASPRQTRILIGGAFGSLLSEAGKLYRLGCGRSAPDPVDVPEEFVEETNLPARLIYTVATDREIVGPVGVQAARDTQELIEAALLSVESGRPVSLPLR